MKANPEVEFHCNLRGEFMDFKRDFLKNILKEFYDPKKQPNEESKEGEGEEVKNSAEPPPHRNTRF
jgi:hypothetical protein